MKNPIFYQNFQYHSLLVMAVSFKKRKAIFEIKVKEESMNGFYKFVSILKL